MAAGGKVIDLRKRRIERLAVDFAREPHTGHVIVDVDKIDSVDVWHAAARVAAPGRAFFRHWSGLESKSD